MFTLLVSSVWFVFLIVVLVFIHELGHFLAARFFGVRVEVFSVGFGQSIKSKTDKQGTEWRLSWIPLGGYVKMFGDFGPASIENKEAMEAMSEEEKRVAFHSKNLWQKSIIAFAGPAFNYILAVVVLFMLVYTQGVNVIKPVINEIMPGSPADHAGLQVEDLILSVNDKKIDNFLMLHEIIADNRDLPMKMEIERNNYVVELIVEPHTKIVNGNQSYYIGIKCSEIEHRPAGLIEAIVVANKMTYTFCLEILQSLGRMLTGDKILIQNIGGPAKIVQYASQSIEHGISSMLWLLAALSINLCVLNLLPIPILDGGHLLYYAIQGIFGPLPSKIQNAGYWLGGALLLFVMIFATWNDIISFIK